MPSSIADLEARLDSVEQRLAALEGAATDTSDYDAESAAPTLGDGFAANASTHVGRVLLIFGGAYLLRAITEYQFVPTAVGLAMGATYAVFWLFMANRRGRDESQHTTAEFLGGTSVFLTLPLLHEATTRFALLSGVAGVVALGIYCALAMFVAVRHRLAILAWLVMVGGIVAAMASLVATHAAVPVAAFLLLLGLGSMWAVYWRGSLGLRWLGLRWLGAIGANLGVIALLALAYSEQWTIEPKLAFGFAAALLITYLSSITFHTHVRAQVVSLFESVQALVAGTIVLGSAAAAVRAGFLDMATVGVLGVVLGLGGYGLAIVRETRTLRYPNFFYYSTFGLVFLLVGTALLLPMGVAAVIWAVMAMAMAQFSARTGWVSLSLQCTILLVAAGAGSGLLAAAQHALTGDPVATWSELEAAHAMVAVATVACLFIPVAQRSDRWGTLAGLPQLIVLALSVWEVGGLAIAAGAHILLGAGPAESAPAIIAALRTAVLSIASVTLALSSRHRRWPEARWLVYPVLLLVFAKLFVEDFPNGQPASLFVALAFVGGALLLVARLVKRRQG